MCLTPWPLLYAKKTKLHTGPFIQFSNLIRNALVSSDKITRTISEELNYLENYIALEKIRFENKFDFRIEIDDETDTNTHIPKMLLQTYVENAIKHGIRNMQGKGLVKVVVTKTDKNLVFIVSDNGIGREKAKEYAQNSTGFGLRIIQDYFDLFNEFNTSKN